MLDWSHALQAHRIVERHVTAGQVDPKLQMPEILVSGVVGIRVTLRWSGVTMGSGQWPADVDHAAAEAPTPGPNQCLGRAANLAFMASAATHRALQVVQQRLLDRHRSVVASGAGAPVGDPQSLTDAGPYLQADLQVAYDMQPLRLEGQDLWQSFYDQLIPGYHGLRITDSSDRQAIRTAWIWPASALAGNMSPKSQLVRLLADLGYRSRDLSQMVRRAGLSLERFRTIHIVRPGRNLPVARLVQGVTDNDSIPFSSRSLEDIAHRGTDFLLRRRRPDGHLAGTYHPSTDRYDPAVASAQDSALAVYALTRRATLLAQSDPDEQQLADAIKTARLLAGRLVRQLTDEPGTDHRPTDPITLSLLLMALLESPALDQLRDDRTRLVSQLRSMRNRDGTFRSGTTLQSPPLKRSAQALVVCALSSLYEQTRDKHLGQQLAQSQNALWQEADTQAMLDMAPWLAISEFRMRRLMKADPAGPLKTLIDALRRRSMATSSRVDRGRTERQTNPSPVLNWQSAHGVWVLALALKQQDPDDKQEVIPWILDCMTACQSLRDLMFDEPGCYYVRSHPDALGGVRKVVWDNRLGIGPTAMTILAVTQLQQTLVQLDRAGVLDSSRSPVGEPTQQQ